MHEKLLPNDFLGLTSAGGSQGTYFFLPPPPKKTLKSTVFGLKWWILHVNRSVLHQELSRKGPMVHGGHNFTNKWQISYPNFQHKKIPKKSDLGFDMSLTHDMTFLAFVLSWNPSNTIYMRSKNKFYPNWARNMAFNRWGLIAPPPPLTGECGELGLRAQMSWIFCVNSQGLLRSVDLDLLSLGIIYWMTTLKK